MNNTCNICNKKIQNLEIDYSITICKHIYHTSCLLNYMQKSYFCPKCRKELLKNKFETDETDKLDEPEEINTKSNNLFNFNLINFRLKN